MKRLLVVVLGGLACTLVHAQQSNQAYYEEQQRIRAQQHAAEMTRLGMQQAAQATRYAQPASPPPPPPPRYYGAVAVDQHGGLWVASYDLDGDSAETRARVACDTSDPAAECESLGWFSEQCAALARAPDGRVFPRYDPIGLLASRAAMKDCNAGSEAGGCKLMSPPLCVGSAYRPTDIDAALHASEAVLDAWSKMSDPRK